MICIYHKGCMDGFGAAWVVKKAYPDQEIEFIPAKYGDVPPDVANQHVFIVDFSYPHDVLMEMDEHCKYIQVIDHHKTAEEALADLPFAHFDGSKSGAILTWEYFFPNELPPSFLTYIQDRDLWKFELDGSRAVNAAMYSYQMDFEIWDGFAQDIQINNLFLEGISILRDRQKTIDSLTAGWAIEIINFEGHKVPLLNCPHWLASEVLNVLAQDHPFAISYSDSKDQRTFQLRSAESGVDVSEIAKKHGGGGHSHAAGFTRNKESVN